MDNKKIDKISSSKKRSFEFTSKGIISFKIENDPYS